MDLDYLQKRNYRQDRRGIKTRVECWEGIHRKHKDLDRGGLWKMGCIAHGNCPHSQPDLGA